jgi:spore germination protein GerM
MSRNPGRAWATLLGALLLAGCQPQPPGAAQGGKAAEQPSVVTVYFADKGVGYLEAEAHDIPPTSDKVTLATAAVKALLAGPTEPGHVSVLPKGVRLNQVTLKGSAATVDLSPNFVDDFQGGSHVAALAVYSLVNTVTAVEGIATVQLLCDGQQRNEFGGVLSIAKPLAADKSLLGGEKLSK